MITIENAVEDVIEVPPTTWAFSCPHCPAWVDLHMWWIAARQENGAFHIVPRVNVPDVALRVWNHCVETGHTVVPDQLSTEIDIQVKGQLTKQGPRLAQVLRILTGTS